MRIAASAAESPAQTEPRNETNKVAIWVGVYKGVAAHDLGKNALLESRHCAATRAKPLDIFMFAVHRYALPCSEPANPKPTRQKGLVQVPADPILA